jgi:hypothetical protein
VVVATGPRSGRTASPAPPARLPLLLAALALAGCATAALPRTNLPRTLPNADEIGRLERVEVVSTAPAPVVRLLAASLAGGGKQEEAVSRIAVDASAGDLLDALAAAGACATRRPFARVDGRPGSGATGAVLSADLKSISLASGPGPDPIAALFLEVETRLEVPADTSVPGSTRHRFKPRRHLVADPKPRPLSQWTTGDGAPVRQAVAALAAELAPRVVDDLAWGVLPADCDHLLPPRARRQATDRPAPAPEGGGSVPGEAAAEPVVTDVRAISRGPSRSGQKVVAGMGGALAGGLGGLLGCAKGGGLSLGPAPCLVLASLGAVIVGAMAAEKAGNLPTEPSEETRRAIELANAMTPARLAEAVARANVALRQATPVGQAAPLLGVSLVRLIEEPGVPGGHSSGDAGVRGVPLGAVPSFEEQVAEVPPWLAGLELELTLRPADGQPGGQRRRCVVGPGSVPEVLWFDRDAALLYGAIEAQLSRGVTWGASGLAPQGGDGPCAAPAPPPPPGPRPPDPEPVPESATFGS